MIDLNVGTLTDLCRAVAPAMIKRKSGAILNVASTAAFQPGPKMAVYFATKAFVLSLSEAIHEELKPYGIQGQLPVPGPTRTEFGDVAGFGGNGLFDRVAMNAPKSSKAGLTASTHNRAVVVPGLDEQDRARRARASRRARSFAKSPGRSNIDRTSEPVAVAAVPYPV